MVMVTLSKGPDFQAENNMAENKSQQTRKARKAAVSRPLQRVDLNLQLLPTPPDSRSTELEKLKRLDCSPFSNRRSPLDREELHNGAPPVRGFLVLFWIIITMYGGISMYRNAGGGYLGMTLKLWKSSYSDLRALLTMVGVVYFYTYTVLPYQWMQAKGWISPHERRTRLGIRLALESGPIVMSLIVAKYWTWPPMQTATLTMIALSMFMKMHAFMAENERFDRDYHQCRQQGKLLDTVKEPNGSSSRTSTDLSYPDNLTFRNYTTFLWMPTYIYSLSYPRTKKINWNNLAERTIGIVVIVTLYYIVIEQHIIPIFHADPPLKWIDAYIDLILPCVACMMLVFFMVWDYMLNWAAEVTFFADRQFYADWWNCTDMGEFSRKWNIPVHKFLQHYIYRELYQDFGWSKSMSMAATFLYSSIFHEFVLSSMSGKFRIWILVMQMMQLPLIYVSTRIGLHRFPFLANLLWWLSIIYGVPLIVMLYHRN